VGWAGLGPTVLSASFDLGQNRPGLEKNLPPACRTIFILHAGGA